MSEVVVFQWKHESHADAPSVFDAIDELEGTK